MLQKKNAILVIEDDMPMRKLLGISLETAGHKIVECDNAREGLRLCATVKPDLILLDLGLPDMDGREVIANVRRWSHTPIIVCSVRNNDQDVVSALNAGADDYISKPFACEVLLARIYANLRKAAAKIAGEPQLINGPIRMDMVRHEVFLHGEKLSLTPREYELLRYLLIHRGEMLMHCRILKDVWGQAHSDEIQYLRVYISQLRDKLEPQPSMPRYIFTEPGVGYRLERIVDSSPAEMRQAATTQRA